MRHIHITLKKAKNYTFLLYIVIMFLSACSPSISRTDQNGLVVKKRNVHQFKRIDGNKVKRKDLKRLRSWKRKKKQELKKTTQIKM